MPYDPIPLPHPQRPWLCLMVRLSGDEQICAWAYMNEAATTPAAMLSIVTELGESADSNAKLIDVDATILTLEFFTAWEGPGEDLVLPDEDSRIEITDEGTLIALRAALLQAARELRGEMVDADANAS